MTDIIFTCSTCNARVANAADVRAELAAKDKLIHEMEATLNATEWAQIAVAAKDKEIARLREIETAATNYRAAETDGTPRMWRGKALQDLANTLDLALGAHASAEIQDA